MWGFLGKVWKVIRYVGYDMLISWLMPKQKDQGIQPQDLQSPPITKQGTPIRIAAGRQRQEMSNLVDYGNIQSYAIRAKGGKK